MVQPYLDIKITGAEGDGNTKTLILDVTPMYQKVATTADLDSNGEIKVQKGADKVEGANAVILASGEMKITEPVTVTIPLPDSFAATNDAKIGHKGYVYTGTIDNNHVLTFVNPHGFSEIIIGAVVALPPRTRPPARSTATCRRLWTRPRTARPLLLRPNPRQARPSPWVATAARSR